jgi:protein ImuA
MSPQETRDLLRRRIAELEDRSLQLTACEEEITALPRWHFGLEEVDRVLPNGALLFAALHEVEPKTYQDLPAASGFCAALLTRLLGSLKRSARQTVLWCTRAHEEREFGALYGPGLKALGLDPGHLLIVSLKREQEVLWAMEEGLSTPQLAGVVGEVGKAGLTATRRLHLAARKSGVPALLLRRAKDPVPTAARSRWCISGATSTPPAFDPKAPGSARWRVELLRCRGGRPEGAPTDWTLEWNHETHRFHLAAPLADRAAQPRPQTSRIITFRQAG